MEIWSNLLLSFEENLENTAMVCKWAHEANVRVEGELGTVPYHELGERKSKLTSPEEADLFCSRTSVDWLAVSVGNVHRLIGRKVSIRFPVLHQIEQACPAPLVIHGASGVESADLLKAKKCRVGKINVGTALRKAFGETLREQVNRNPNMYDRLELFREPSLMVELTAYEILKQYSEMKPKGSALS